MRSSCATSRSGIPAAARSSVHPGPAGSTFCPNAIRVARSVAGPTKAVTSQAMVVIPTCTMVIGAKPAPGMKYGTRREVTSDIADTGRARYSGHRRSVTRAT